MLDYKKIIDISLALSKDTITYPGNTPIKIVSFKSPSGLTFLSTITIGSHAGTHLDVPRHVRESGKSVDKVPFIHLIGKCRVLDFTRSVESIKKDELERKNIKKGERILAKTANSTRGFKTAYNDYVYLSSEAAAYLAKIEINLFGIDYLSVKKQGSKDNRPHTNLLDKNIPIIEGVDLSKTEEGKYYLIALPLKFVGLDGSPVRAILLK